MSFDDLRKITEFALTLAGALLFCGAVVVLILASISTWRRMRQTQLAIPVLIDSTGDSSVGAATAGLTHQLQESLVAVLPGFAQYVMDHITRPSEPMAELLQESDVRRLLEVRLKSIENSQAELIQKAQALLPANAREPYLIVATALFRPKEIRISGVLEERRSSMGGIGISLDISRVDGTAADKKVTIWEDDPSELFGSARGELVAAAKEPLERFYDLIDAAVRVIACEVLRQQLIFDLERPRGFRLSRRGDRRADHGRPDEGVGLLHDRWIALVELLGGELYRDLAPGTRHAMKSCYQLSVDALTKAAARVDHPQVRYDLAAAKSELARRTRDRHKRVALLQESERLFAQARAEFLRAAKDEQTPEEVAALRGRIFGLEAQSSINKTLLAASLPTSRSQASRAVAAALQLLDADPHDYRGNGGALYNLACALSRAAETAPLVELGLDRERCLSTAHRSLLFACAANPGWWRNIAVDPDLRVLLPAILEARPLMGDLSPEEAESVEALDQYVEKVIESTLKRRSADAEAGPRAPDAMPLPAPTADEVLHLLVDLGELRESGLLSDQEFDSKKSELLRRL